MVTGIRILMKIIVIILTTIITILFCVHKKPHIFIVGEGRCCRCSTMIPGIFHGCTDADGFITMCYEGHL